MIISLSKYFSLLAIIIFCLGTSLTQAGVGDFTPANSSSLRTNGITASYNNNHGTGSSIQFNLSTDNVFLAYYKHHTGESAHMDERDFLTANNTSTATSYDHSLSNLAVGDVVNLLVWVHNNATHVCGGGNPSSAVTVSFDWSTPTSVTASISASNAEPSTITDTVTLGFANNNSTLELSGSTATIRQLANPDAGYCNNSSPSWSVSASGLSASTSSASVNIGSVNGSYGNFRIVEIPLVVVLDTDTDTDTVTSATGGGGSAVVNTTTGVCQLNTAGRAVWSCNNVYPTRGSVNYDDYQDCVTNTTSTTDSCLAAWATDNGYDTCIEPLGARDTSWVNTQCTASIPSVASGTTCTSGTSCPHCFGAGTFVTKDIISNNPVARSETATYQARVTLGVHDSVNYFINSGQIKLYDFVVPSASGSIWNRHGLSDASVKNNENKIWAWNGTYFLRDMSSDEIVALNNGGYEFVLEYTMDTSLAVNKDTAQLKNVAFAVVEYDYTDLSPSCTSGCAGTVTVGVGDNACADSATMARLLFSGSSVGDDAILELVRPFVQAQSGGNIGLQFDVNEVERIRAQSTGSLIVEDLSTTAGVYLNPDPATAREVTDLNDVKNYQEVSRDDYYANLKQNNESTNLPEFPGRVFLTSRANNRIFFLDTASLILPSSLDVGGESMTIIIEDGNLIIGQDFRVNNGFVAFIVRKGDILIDPRVTSLEGMFLAERGKFRSVSTPGSSDTKSYDPLVVSGALMGSLYDFLQYRLFIGNNPGSVLEPAIKILFDLRLLTNTPPALQQFLGENWRQDIE